jgi:hypothetical protein
MLPATTLKPRSNYTTTCATPESCNDAPKYYSAPSFYTKAPYCNNTTEAPEYYTTEAPEYYTTEAPEYYTTEAPEYYTTEASAYYRS